MPTVGYQSANNATLWLPQCRKCKPLVTKEPEMPNFGHECQNATQGAKNANFWSCRCQNAKFLNQRAKNVKFWCQSVQNDKSCSPKCPNCQILGQRGPKCQKMPPLQGGVASSSPNPPTRGGSHRCGHAETSSKRVHETDTSRKLR